MPLLLDEFWRTDPVQELIAEEQAKFLTHLPNTGIHMREGDLGYRHPEKAAKWIPTL